MTYKHCIDKQIVGWHYNTVDRYALLENITVTKHLKLNKLISTNSAINKSGHGLNKDIPLLNSVRLNVTKAYLNHPKLWDKIKGITLHVTSKNLLFSSEQYTAFYKCFCCCGQSPQIIKSKKAIAAFKVIKGAIVGAHNNLRNKNARFFSYKWAFLAAELPSSQLILAPKYQTALIIKNATPLKQGSIGINNVFVFPELDKLDYNLFKFIVGFDLIINYKSI